VNYIFALFVILIPSFLFAGQVSTVCHNELSSWIKTNKKLSIVDIQDAEGFRAHNYDHSFAAGNDPVRLKKITARLRSAKGKVIVVSATGGNDAVHAAESLERGGIQHSRIMVLEGGMEAAAKNAACECCKPAKSGAAE
jgi:rhodanese-related sulfurtransferase